MIEGVLSGTAVFAVRDDGSFLMVRRAKKGAGSGQWSCPGGTVELGETWQDCSIRELKEETGLSAGSPRLLAVTTGAQDACGWLTVWSRCDYLGGDVILNHEASEWAWADCRDLEHMDLWDGHWVPLLGNVGGIAGLEQALR
jgi:8-oxo-dGTP diphosphatase